MKGKLLAVGLLLGNPAFAADFTIDDAAAFPFSADLTASPSGDRVAWVRDVNGVRNVYEAAAPDWRAKPVTQFTEDDGQELTQLTFTPDGKRLVFVRGGDHGSNWPAKNNLQPNPTSSPVEPKVTLWVTDGTAKALTEGDQPTISKDGKLAYVKNGQVWSIGLDGGDAEKLFFDRGKDTDLAWSPDGKHLAFVSERDDHSFVGVFTAKSEPLHWMAPSFGFDKAPIWSPDGTKLAFTHQPGQAGPVTILRRIRVKLHPWSIMVASLADGQGHTAWQSGKRPRDSYPDVKNNANLHWADDATLTFLSCMDNWPHLYSVAAAGGEAKLLTPGNFMVEDIAAKDGSLTYSANSGAKPEDDDRRHLFRVSIGGKPNELTEGTGSEWAPALLGQDLAFISADARRPGTVELLSGGKRAMLAGQEPPANFPGGQFIEPKKVTFTAQDGLTIHGQLFERPDGKKKPAVIFVHGGPPRQMLLGWSYMFYYSNSYAVNQYLAAHGFVVLSVNYRLGIGYGYDFQHPDEGGAGGASEYRDVLAGAKFLQGLPEVDAKRIGIWGGSYGGYLTALALARNSDIFKAGVDFHGVHDWSLTMGERGPAPYIRAETGNREEEMKIAFASSPVADVDRWTSPVLLIQADDDRNVAVIETIDLARRLTDRGIEHEELMIPDDIHDFLRRGNWSKADRATVEFLKRKL
jgi:dipeptidyl aminopeptidase/acylaminoacyl peptidase